MLHYVTVATNTENVRFKDYLSASSRHFRIDLAVLGDGADWGGLTFKDVLLRKYLERLPSDDLVFFCDAYDSFFCRSHEALGNAFEYFRAPVVFSCEKRCWPDANRRDRFPTTPSRWKYLNSGGFIGRVGALRSLLEEEIPSHEIGEFTWSNQAAWVARYMRHPDVIALDHQCRIFQTLAHTSFLQEVVVRNGRWCNKITGTEPFHVHFNGSAESRFLDLAAGWVPWRDRRPTSSLRTLFALARDHVRVRRGIRRMGIENRSPLA